MFIIQIYYFCVQNNTDVAHLAFVMTFPPEAITTSWFESLTYLCVPCVFCQVVVKTKADYDGESKKGKLRSPKIAEFSISIIEGVSERLKVRIMSLTSSAASIYHPISNTTHAPTHAYTGEQTVVPLQLRILFTVTIIFPLQSMFHTSLLGPPSSPVSCAACLLVWTTQGDIILNDSLNPALKSSLIQLLPWRWPPNGSISPTSLDTPLGRQMCLAAHTLWNE